LIGYSGFARLNSLALDNVGRFVSVGGTAADALLTINPTTGAGTQISTLNFGHPIDVRALACSSAGDLYAVNNQVPGFISPQDLYRVNLATGVGTFVATLSAQCQALDFDAAGTLYGWGALTANQWGLMKIDPATGAITDINPLHPSRGVTIQSIVFGPDGTLYGADDQLYRINVTTGRRKRSALADIFRSGGLKCCRSRGR